MTTIKSGKMDGLLTLIRKGRLFGPMDLGQCDILVGAEKIIRIGKNLTPPRQWDIHIVEARGKIITPGFIDLHVHLTGGGGEGGPATRVPEIQLSRITRAGVTTVLGALGTDNVTRTPESLLAKAIALNKEGISAYMVVGAYQLPLVNLTGSVRKDIALIDQVLGVGEIALSDHRSSQPTFEEFIQLVAQARVGGMLGAKPGLVVVHMGQGKWGMDYLFRMACETDIPIDQVLPTHVNRTRRLFREAQRFGKMGGNLDITATCPGADWEIPTDEVFKELIATGIEWRQLSLSSDANGSMPVFDTGGVLLRLGVAEIANLTNDIRGLLLAGSAPVSDILTCVTVNPAKRMGLERQKGTLEPGKDADILVWSSDWRLEQVFARGRMMVSEGKAVVKGTFEG